MIKVGNILIDPNDISSIHLDMKTTPPVSNHERGCQVIQVVYKSGVVKNFSSAEIGMSYNDFIEFYGIKKIKDAVLYAKDLKDRYTVLWLNYKYFKGEFLE